MLLETDNVAGASPEIVEAIAAVADGEMPPYGADPVTERLAARFCELFGQEVEICPTVSGTAANALSLSLIAPPFSTVFCHDGAHVLKGEMGSVEFYSHGTRLVPVGGPEGRIDPAKLRERLDEDSFYPSQPAASAVSITQLSEAGTLYRAGEIEEIARLCRARGLRLHMDGARFAAAVAALGVSPAEASVRLGVDILSFGATKNGTMMADCIVVFTPGLTDQLRARRKRAGLTLAKLRFLSAQLEAYLQDDLWLRNARRANAAMRRLTEALAAVPGVTLLHPAEANMAFLKLERGLAEALQSQGCELRIRGGSPDGGHVCRLVTSFATTAEQVDEVARTFERAAAGLRA